MGAEQFTQPTAAKRVGNHERTGWREPRVLDQRSRRSAVRELTQRTRERQRVAGDLRAGDVSLLLPTAAEVGVAVDAERDGQRDQQAPTTEQGADEQDQR